MLRSLTCMVQRNPLPPAISFWKSLFFVPWDSLASLARAGSLRSRPRGDVACSPRPVGQFCPHSLSAHATSPNASGYNHPGTLAGASPACRRKLARFARSHELAALAPSRGCRLFSVSARAILPVLPLRTGHIPECLQLQPPRHPFGSLAIPPDAFSYNHLSPTSPPRPFSGRGAPRHCLASALPLSAVKPAFSGNSSPPCP